MSAKVVTRARRKRSKKSTQEKENPDQLSVSDLWRARRAKAKATREEKLKAVTAELEQAQEQLKQQKEAEASQQSERLKSISSGGSVIAEKIFEPFDAIIKAFEARLQPQQTAEQRWMTYPYAVLEKKDSRCVNN